MEIRSTQQANGLALCDSQVLAIDCVQLLPADARDII